MPSTPAARPPVRVLPVPAYDPPYDDELPPQWWPPDVIQPLLELPGLPWTEDAAPRSDRRRSGAEQPGRAEPPAATASPPTVAAAARFVNTCLEILNGYRPLSHVRALADPLAASAVLAELTGATRRLGSVARREGLLRLRAMRTCEPRPGVAEIAVVVGVLGPAGGTSRAAGSGTAAGGGTRSGRAWALAFRLERQHGRWLCTAAQLL